MNALKKTNKRTALSSINTGEKFSVEYIDSNKSIKKRLFDLGITKKCELIFLFENPFRNMRAYLIKNTIIALRNEDASKIYGHAVA